MGFNSAFKGLREREVTFDIAAFPKLPFTCCAAACGIKFSNKRMESNTIAVQNNSLPDGAKVTPHVLLCAASDVDPFLSQARKFVCYWKQKRVG